jgi:hypothetical protein
MGDLLAEVVPLAAAAAIGPVVFLVRLTMLTGAAACLARIGPRPTPERP